MIVRRIFVINELCIRPTMNGPRPEGQPSFEGRTWLKNNKETPIPKKLAMPMAGVKNRPECAKYPTLSLIHI